jgi:hypothetical protein
MFEAAITSLAYTALVGGVCKAIYRGRLKLLVMVILSHWLCTTGTYSTVHNRSYVIIRCLSNIASVRLYRSITNGWITSQPIALEPRLGIGSSDAQWEPVLGPVWGFIFGPEPEEDNRRHPGA